VILNVSLGDNYFMDLGEVVKICHSHIMEIENFLPFGMTGQELIEGNKVMGNIILANFSMKVGVEK
jgi:hypothetical protein